MTIKEKTITLIDQLKSTCTSFGMGNDGNEYKIITQVFLYKFLNDKFGYELKNCDSQFKNKFAKSESWEKAYSNLSETDRQMLRYAISPDVPFLKPEHLISSLWNQQTKGDFDLIFDQTMLDIADLNIDIFSTQTDKNVKIPLFEALTGYVTNPSDRAPFARAVVDKLVNFSFEEAFGEGYDFFSGIFEYLIKDYNTAGGGKYAEYYTPRAIAQIMAKLLVGEEDELHSVECYDPSAGTGTLLIALANRIGTNRSTIFAQDISQRSNKMLKLNLILNGLVSSLDHAIQGDTLVAPYHKSDDGKRLRQFDYIVSNPPFNMDFSDTRESIAAMPARFWAGVPSIPPKKKESMAIYTCFIQHVINSLKDGGKAAIVVPTPFLTKGKGIEAKIRRHLIDEKILDGVITMPTNIFSTTGTNVSVLFLHKGKEDDVVMFVEASILGSKSTESERNQKTVLSPEEQTKIVEAYINKDVENGFSIHATYDLIIKNDYRLSPNTYFSHSLMFKTLDEPEYNRLLLQKTEALKLYFTKELDDLLQLTFNRWFVQFDFPCNGVPYKASGGEMVFNELLDTEIPKGWDVKKIVPGVCSIVDCLHSKKPAYFFENEDSYLLQLDNITPEGRIDVSDKYYISKADYKIWSDKIEIQSGDFVITNAGRAGAISMVPDGIKCAIGRNMTAIRANTISPYYLRLFLSSPYMDRFLAANLDEGAFFKSFNVKSIKKICVLIPPKEILDEYLYFAQPLVKKVLNGISIQSEISSIKQLLGMNNSLT